MNDSLELLLAASPRPADLPERLAEAVRARGSDRPLLRRCMAAVAPGDSAAGLAWAVAIQEACPHPLHAVLAEIAAAEGEDAPRRRFAARLAETAAEAFAGVARAFDAALDGRPADRPDAALVIDWHGPALTWLRFIKPSPRTLPLFRPDAQQAADLAASGIAVEALRAFVAEWRRPLPAWQAVLDAAPLPGPAARERVLGAEAEVAWVDRALADGGVTMADPLDGTRRTAVDGFVSTYHTTYLFRGVEPFFLIVGGPWHAPQGLYLPRRDLIISFGGEGGVHLRAEALAGRMATFLRRYVQAANAPAAPARGPTLCLPPSADFAGQLWCLQTGIERAIRLGLIGRIGALRVIGPEFLGPVETLFPELAGIPIERAAHDPGFGIAADPSLVPLPAAGFMLPRSLTDRVVAAMQARPRGGPDAVEPGDIARDPAAPVVWIGLSPPGTGWGAQEGGVVEVMKRLAAHRPDALFLLDGFSHPIGADPGRDPAPPALPGLRAMAERIRAAAPDPARVVNMVGNTLRESCLWAREADVYVTPHELPHQKVAWFGDAPGVVCAPPGMMPVQAERSAGFCAAEGAAAPRLVVGRPAAGAARGAPHELDAAEIAGLLWELLEPRLAARAARPAGAAPQSPPAARAGGTPAEAKGKGDGKAARGRKAGKGRSKKRR